MQFDVHFRRIMSVHSLSNDAAYEEVFERKGICFPPEWAFLLGSFKMKILFVYCTLIWRVNNYVCNKVKA